MQPTGLDRPLSLAVLVAAAFNAIASASFPVLERRPSAATVGAVTLLLVSHAAAYWTRERVVDRCGVVAYVGLQAALPFAVGMLGAPLPLVLALYVAVSAQTVLSVGQRPWAAVLITLGAVVLFGANAIASSTLYRGATAGLMLATFGVAAYAIAALLGRRPPVVTTAEGTSSVRRTETADADTALTPRELEVLANLVAGAKNSEIARRMRISERTVKAHLGSIYQKLGVDARAGAVAAAITRGLVTHSGRAEGEGQR